MTRKYTKKTNIYEATFYSCDTRTEFYFYSDFRKGSQRNLEDFESAYKRVYGNSGFRYIDLSSVEIQKYYFFGQQVY